MSKQYSIYEAKAKFSKLLRQVKLGEEVVVTERGVPIARIVALPKEEATQTRMEWLLSSGLMTAAKQTDDFPAGTQKRRRFNDFLRTENESVPYGHSLWFRCLLKRY